MRSRLHSLLHALDAMVTDGHSEAGAAAGAGCEQAAMRLNALSAVLVLLRKPVPLRFLRRAVAPAAVPAAAASA